MLLALAVLGAGSAAALPMPALRLVCYAQDATLATMLRPHLDAFAVVYGPLGLVVDWCAGALADSDATAPRQVLALYDPDGSPVALMEEDSLDLYAIYRHCERRLRGRHQPTFHAHTAEVLAQYRETDALAVALDEDILVQLADLLATERDGVLVLPPGCSDCLLGKYEVVLAALFTERPTIPVIVFEAEASTNLAAFGWHGIAYLLPLNASARLLALRQHGRYAPVIAHAASGEIQITAVREEAWR